MAYKGSLIELPLLGTYWVYKPHVLNTVWAITL